MDQPAVQQCSGVCVVSPLWLYRLGMRTLWEPWQVKGGLRGCFGALSLLYPANDTCHFCSLSPLDRSGHMGSLATRGRLGGGSVCNSVVSITWRSTYRSWGIGDKHGYVVSITWPV